VIIANAKGMKRILLLVLAILLMVPAHAQVGRYKNIKLLYPGYSLKLDTATGQLWAVHYDSEAGGNIEEVILKKQSHNGSQTGRYELRRTRQIGTYQVFDTSGGDYVTVKWTPKGKNGEPVEASVDSVLSVISDGVKRMLQGLEEGIDSMRESLRDTVQVI